MSDRVTWGGAGRDLGPPLAAAAAEPPRGSGREADLPPPGRGRGERSAPARASIPARGLGPAEAAAELAPQERLCELLPASSAHSDGLRPRLRLGRCPLSTSHRPGPPPAAPRSWQVP